MLKCTKLSTICSTAYSTILCVNCKCMMILCRNAIVNYTNQTYTTFSHYFRAIKYRTIA